MDLGIPSVQVSAMGEPRAEADSGMATRHDRTVSHGLGHSHGANPPGSGGQLCRLLAFTQRRRKRVSYSVSNAGRKVSVGV
jgi:hypothetical protein